MLCLTIYAFCFIALPLIGTEEEKQIFHQARQNARSQLARCKNTTCVEQLLYAEEDDVFDALLFENNIKRAERERFKRTWMDEKKETQKILSDHSINRKDSLGVYHDEEQLGETLIRLTKEALVQNNINPNMVTIGTDKELFTENTTKHSALIGRATVFVGEESQKFHSARILLNTESTDCDAHLIAHEVTHIKELHGFKGCRLNKTFNIQPDTLDAKNWNRSTEKQAELFPLIRSKDKKVTEQLTQQLLKKIMPQCISMARSGILNSMWHESYALDTHPGCSELLPYILKIEELNKKNVCPMLNMFKHT